MQRWPPNAHPLHDCNACASNCAPTLFPRTLTPKQTQIRRRVPPGAQAHGSGDPVHGKCGPQHEWLAGARHVLPLHLCLRAGCGCQEPGPRALLTRPHALMHSCMHNVRGMGAVFHHTWADSASGWEAYHFRPHRVRHAGLPAPRPMHPAYTPTLAPTRWLARCQSTAASWQDSVHVVFPLDRVSHSFRLCFSFPLCFSRSLDIAASCRASVGPGAQGQ